jgi:arylsulfatase A-like enzyme
MAKLKSLNLDKNTLVIFTSDNGGAAYIGINSSTMLRGGKLTHFEGGLRIPFMMQWQGHIRPNTVYDKPVSHLDIFQTVAVATHTPTNSLVLDGKNLLYYLQKPAETPHDTLFWRNVYSKAVRVDSLKLYVNEKNKVSYLFDLKNDMSETTDLSEKLPAEKKRLAAILAEWEKGMVTPLWKQSVNNSIKGGDKYYYFPN